MKFAGTTMTKPEKTPSYLFGVRKTLALIAGVSSMAISATGAHAAGTLAGTDIINIAKATYDGPDGPVEVDSNPVTIKVDELLDVTVVSSDPGDIATDPAATAQVTTYQVTNSGNGEEAFTLTADTAKGGDEFDTTFEQIVLDTNGNGIYDPGVDTIYTPGTNDPVLKPDESVTVFILSTIPADAADGERAEIELSAVAITGSGVPGTTFAGAGDGGGLGRAAPDAAPVLRRRLFPARPQ